MSVWIWIVLIVFAFWFGQKYGKTNYKYRKRFLIKSIIIIFAVCFTVPAILGLLTFLSPTLWVPIMEKLPMVVQETIFYDLMFIGRGIFFVLAVVAGVLWFFGVRYRVYR